MYSVLFRDLRNQPLQIFEIGLGSGNPGIAFTMGPSARPGASLRGWRELFPQARIYGADIDREVLFQEDRIETMFCDQLDTEVIRNMWSHPNLRGGLDIIVDDGLHTFEANRLFLDASLDKLRPGGYFVVEDIENTTVPEWRKALETEYTQRYPDHQFALLSLPNKDNNFDNTLLVVHRPQ